MNPHNNCRHLLDDLSDYLDGEASQEICAEIDRHLTDCEECQVVVDTLRKTVLLYRQLPPPDLPFQARERLYRALDLQDYLSNQT
jgi:anti-sigma factor RsiW